MPVFQADLNGVGSNDGRIVYLFPQADYDENNATWIPKTQIIQTSVFGVSLDGTVVVGFDKKYLTTEGYKFKYWIERQTIVDKIKGGIQGQGFIYLPDGIFPEFTEQQQEGIGNGNFQGYFISDTLFVLSYRFQYYNDNHSAVTLQGTCEYNVNLNASDPKDMFKLYSKNSYYLWDNMPVVTGDLYSMGTIPISGKEMWLYNSDMAVNRVLLHRALNNYQDVIGLRYHGTNYYK